MSNHAPKTTLRDRIDEVSDRITERRTVEHTAALFLLALVLVSGIVLLCRGCELNTRQGAVERFIQEKAIQHGR